MEELNQHLNSVKIPQGDDKIYKDECVFSFDTPESPNGLFISLKTFLGFSRDFVEGYYKKTGNAIFLNIKRTKQAQINQNNDGPAKKITKLAIGTPGGFIPDEKKYTYDETYEIIILPNFTSIKYPSVDLPEQIIKSITGILEAESAIKIAEREALAGTWDGEARIITKHATTLQQLNNGKKIPPNNWKCEKCDLTQNLWLNLTDGSILCGRKFFNGTGGNDHAIEHYRTTGYPLAVKLGTITKEGNGDVYSYDENDMVDDPNLIIHLSHWGINISNMEKTEKSMIELELDLNQKFGEWVALQEASSKLIPIYGAGYTGLNNLGNSCYLNCVMQTLFIIPDFIKKYVDESINIFNDNYNDPANNFDTQISKLGCGLLSGKYSIEPNNKLNNEDYNRQGISPRMFKNLISRGHPGFSSNRQQDAQEFFLHLINIIDRHCVNKFNPIDCFKFKVEERYQCSSSGKVKYSYRPEYLLPLPIPLDCAINKDEVNTYENDKKTAELNGQSFDTNNTIIRPHIKLSSCLESLAKTEIVEQFYSSAINGKTTATKTTRLSTFPDYLLFHLKKFTVSEDWTPIKLDVAVDMPDILDLNLLRGNGIQKNEELLPETDTPNIPKPVYNEIILNHLIEMGFSPEACKRSLYFTENRSLEAATNWLMEHIADSDFSDIFVPPGIDVQKNKNEFIPGPGLEYLLNLGFNENQAIRALKATDNNIERAVDWIFSHQNDDAAAAAAAADVDMEDDNNKPTDAYRDGDSKYKLVGFISHMGTSTMVGHYVCHLLKDNRWVIFNDEKVALSENPPKELGYIYMYERIKS